MCHCIDSLFANITKSCILFAMNTTNSVSYNVIFNISNCCVTASSIQRYDVKHQHETSAVKYTA